MQIKEIKQDGLSHEYEVTIPANDIEGRVEAKLVEMAPQIRMPGFRPGKVPMPMLKKRYGTSMLGEILESTVNETSAKVMAEKKLRPAMQPKIEVKSFDQGKDLVYSMAFEVVPEIKIKDLKGLKLTKQVAKPSEKEVEESLKRVADSNPETAPIKTKRGTKEGDTVDMDFDGRTADDDVKHPGMQANNHQLKLGSGQFIPGFEEQLIGKKAGDEIEVKVDFPEEYHAAELAGRQAIFDVKIHEILEEVETEINDDFAKKLGMDDVAALKGAIEEQLSKDLEGHSRMKLKKDLLDWLDANHDLEAPQGMLDAEFESIQQQIKAEQGAEDSEISDEDKEELKDIAARRVRLGLVLAEIGNSNNIQVADADLQRAVISEAQKFPGQEKEVFDFYSKNQQALESLRAPLFEDKVVDYIMEIAEVSEKEVSVDELTAPIEDEVEAAKPAAEKKKKPAAKKNGSSSAKASDDKPAKKTAAKKPAAKKKAPAKKKAAAKK